jgi:transcriptional regulator with XRE-family HTH domain
MTSPMEKSIYTEEYQHFLKLLRLARREAKLTQEDMADRLRQTQSFISKCERGERRLDVIELRQFCIAMGIPFVDFIQRLETALD